MAIPFKEYVLLESNKQKKKNPSVVAGNIQYEVAARLIAKHLGHQDHIPALQEIQSHFALTDNARYSHSAAPHISVGRYSGRNEDIIDGKRKIEVVGGGGKMLDSKRGVLKTEEGVNSFFDIKDPKDTQLLRDVLRSGIARGDLHEGVTKTRLSGRNWNRLTTPHTSDGKEYKGLVSRDEDNRNHAMKQIEQHMSSKGITHWSVGNFIIPVQHLSKFIHGVVATQKSNKDKSTLSQPGDQQARLSLRASGIIDPYDTSGKKIGSDTNWHHRLNDLLTSWHESQDENVRRRLSDLEIEKI
jgi:hypothetical protein